MSRTRENFYLPERELRIQPNGDGTRTLVGLIPYSSPSSGLPWTETIAPGAFRDALKPAADVLMLRDHDTSLLLGRTLANTLTLQDSSEGLTFRCKLPNTSAANDLIESMNRKDITGVSFGFVANDDEWASDGAGNLSRVLRHVTLSEISVTSFAAYPAASAAVRSIVPKEFRPLLTRSVDVEDGQDDECDCDCPECLDGNCADCSNLECDRANCAHEGDPDEEDDEDRCQTLSWSERTLLHLEVLARK